MTNLDLEGMCGDWWGTLAATPQFRADRPQDKGRAASAWCIVEETQRASGLSGLIQEIMALNQLSRDSCSMNQDVIDV